MTQQTLDGVSTTLDLTGLKSCIACGLCDGEKLVAVPPEVGGACRVMLVGQNPGPEEVKQGRPFVGPSGQFLRQQISRIGLKDWYITNLVKGYTQKNRPPTAIEITTCKTLWLDKEIDTFKPCIVVTLGLPASGAILGYTLSMAKMNGHFYRSHLYDVEVMPCYHPSPLNHAQYPAIEKAFDELKQWLEQEAKQCSKV